jgi:RNA-directed DNA polymerase
MMHGAEKSDSPKVPVKPANKAERSAAESVEGSGGTKRNAELQSTARTQSRAAVSQAQDRIRGAVTRNKKEKLTALLHHVSIDVLRWGFFSLKKRAAPGIDGVTWDQYAVDLEANLADLHARVHAGRYRALPSRRRYILKADGKQQRPLGIAAIEDKILQAAVVAILTPIYEAEFLGFSYGFRPGRSQHDALDALAFGIKARKTCWILDADIARFFDSLSRDWLVRFVEHRIGDRRIIRLIQKWLKAGVLDEGRLIETTEGTPQGSVASPLLANVYLHYVYDLWVQQWRKRHATGDMIVVRYADDTIVGFQHQQDAEHFLNDLKERLAQFALRLHPEKTRLIEFGPFAAESRARRGAGKPETFDFLGFTHYVTSKQNGTGFQLGRKTHRKRMRAKLREIKEILRQHRHKPIDEQGRWLATVMKGYFAYFAVPTNTPALTAYRWHIIIRWLRSLRRRSQRHRLTWQRMRGYVARYLPPVRVLHPWPEERFRVAHSR